ncbi:MAG: hypothetical protein ACJAUR_002132 [Ulvibacter sp.]|jgi:hypothetical protein
MKKIIFILSFIYSTCTLAQGPPPPAPSMPDKENISLIDELVEVMDYKLYFRVMREQIVNAYALEHSWSIEKINSAIKKISYLDLPDYKRQDMYYNIHANKSSDELKDMITRFKSYSDDEKISEHIEEYGQTIVVNWQSEIQALCRRMDKN